VQFLRFINSRGEEISFDSTAPFVFWRITGLNVPTANPIFTQAVGQHGYTLHDLLMEGREIRVTAHVHGPQGVREMYQKRRELNRVCNPLYGVGTLTYQNDAGTYQIEAFCRSIPYETKLENVQTFSIIFDCPKTFFTTPAQERVLLAYIDGGLEFPLVTPGFLGTMGYEARPFNDGDIDTPLEIIIGGGAVFPTVTNETTGKFVCVERHLQEHEKLYINTDDENTEVSLLTVDEHSNPVKINAYSYLTDDSDLFRLAQGENVLSFNSADNNTRIKIELLFRKRFVGV